MTGFAGSRASLAPRNDALRQFPLFPSGDGGGMSPGTEDGNGAGRGSIGVTAGPVAIGRGAMLAARGGSLLFAARRFGDLGFGFRLARGLSSEQPAWP